jgi:hypothetical protein
VPLSCTPQLTNLPILRFPAPGVGSWAECVPSSGVPQPKPDTDHALWGNCVGQLAMAPGTTVLHMVLLACVAVAPLCAVGSEAMPCEGLACLHLALVRSDPLLPPLEMLYSEASPATQRRFQLLMPGALAARAGIGATDTAEREQGIPLSGIDTAALQAELKKRRMDEERRTEHARQVEHPHAKTTLPSQAQVAEAAHNATTSRTRKSSKVKTIFPACVAHPLAGSAEKVELVEWLVAGLKVSSTPLCTQRMHVRSVAHLLRYLHLHHHRRPARLTAAPCVYAVLRTHTPSH